MEIIDNTSTTTGVFGDLSEGDVFISSDVVYMKINVISTNNAVKLSDGTTTTFEDTEIVTVPTASLTLTN